ncbi:ABC transporter substrate-binding protein [Devosia psychrophila]|jgi:branched-chain amino acid transport system substrate-binding protein|uniref:Amino acid ABC transporter substrate-binding protein n=1 Tax=Devosia psychrophila TaxID=728005 RepID=A0A0F5PWB2_9HYPH|nr:ABC transporter substrate-binding protein [Devosia psychrophila]KKC32681.1 amino acid ABC transporter substrate-binding protein [Devosia psychrophila]SFC52170.1 branched-chain amino acid transport system substrate-binding protein [Devosia psychrophila]
MLNLKNTLALAVAVSTLVVAAPAIAQDTGATIGFIGGFTGPIESLTPPIFAGAELVVKQVNEQGGILGGELKLISADGACDATAAAAAADKVINSDNVTAVVGALCTGETIGAFNGSGLSGNVVFISPASSAPTLTTLEDNDLVYRTTPSDALQGVKLADLLLSKGLKDIAITYVNNDYGKGFADALSAAYTAGGGTIAANVAHEEGKADYRAELGNLTASQNLVVLAYANASGNTILRQAVESGNFTTYVGGDGMVGDDLLSGIDAAAVEGLIATRAGAPEGAATTTYTDLATAAGLEATATYAPQAYDAAFLLALAIEKNGSASRDGLSAALRDVSSAPGEKILPGEWTKAVELIKAGTDIDYEGAGGALDFDAAGDVDGIIVELAVEGGKFVEKGLIK